MNKLKTDIYEIVLDSKTETVNGKPPESFRAQIDFGLYYKEPDLDNSLMASDYATWLAGWLRFAAKNPNKMEDALDFELSGGIIQHP